MTTVAEAEATIKSLEDKQQHLIQRAVELSDERGRIAFAAHADADPKASKRLSAINHEIATLTGESESIQAALVEAGHRVSAARSAAAIVADRVQAIELRAKLARFAELGEQLDDSCWDLSQSLNEMITVLRDIHGLGQIAPTDEQFRVNGTIALKTMLLTLPQIWINDFEFPRLLPSQKKSFKGIVSGWADMIESNITARLGDSARQEAA